LKDEIEEKINKKEEDWVVGGWNWKKNSITKGFKKKLSQPELTYQNHQDNSI